MDVEEFLAAEEEAFYLKNPRDPLLRGYDIRYQETDQPLDASAVSANLHAETLALNLPAP